MSINVVSIMVDGERAAVELNTKGVTKSGAALDEQSVWIIKVQGGLITEGEPPEACAVLSIRRQS